MNAIFGCDQKGGFNPIIEQYASMLRVLKNKRNSIKEELVPPEIRYHIDILLEHIDGEIIRYHQHALDLSQQRILVWGIHKDINKTKELLSPYE